MSKWKSPQIAAKRTNREAKKAEEIRKEKRKSWILLGCIIFIMIGAVVADYFWIRSNARQHHQRHHHQSGQTNSSDSSKSVETNSANHK